MPFLCPLFVVGSFSSVTGLSATVTDEQLNDEYCLECKGYVAEDCSSILFQAVDSFSCLVFLDQLLLTDSFVPEMLH